MDKLEEPLPIDDFSLLLFINLAFNSEYYDYNDSSQKIVFLPKDYKERIEGIMTYDDRYVKEFSKLIDIREYFDNRLCWEKRWMNL